MNSSAADSILFNSELYKKYLEVREHILKNKWYMSERAGRDVGFESALVNYYAFHHNQDQVNS